MLNLYYKTCLNSLKFYFKTFKLEFEFVCRVLRQYFANTWVFKQEYIVILRFALRLYFGVKLYYTLF